MTRPILGVVAALLCGLVAFPSIAADPSPVGQWEVSTGESRYRVSYCGADGQQLCAKLTWVREDLRAENQAFVNSYIVKGAKPASENKWSGKMVYKGHSYEGTVTLVSNNSMRLNGCSGVFCQSFQLNRR
jgi:uncharacterized protein (DUF2147 family)